MRQNDPWGSMQNFMTDFQKMASNPAQYVMDKAGIPKEMANNPDAIIQKMMNDGKISQAQYNAARQAAQRIQGNPMFRQFFR